MGVLSQQARQEQQIRPRVRQVALGVAMAWLALVTGLGWWISQRVVTARLDRLAASAEYEAQTTARIVDRMFAELGGVANTVARQSQVIRLATRYRVDPPGVAELTCE